MRHNLEELVKKDDIDEKLVTRETIYFIENRDCLKKHIDDLCKITWLSTD
jgi:hypothetical protein